MGCTNKTSKDKSKSGRCLSESFIDVLQSDKSRKMVITNYSFFSVISDQNVSSYSRWYPGDSSAFPKKGTNIMEAIKNSLLHL